jgi:hypothetical protein
MWYWTRHRATLSLGFLIFKTGLNPLTLWGCEEDTAHKQVQGREYPLWILAGLLEFKEALKVTGSPWGGGGHGHRNGAAAIFREFGGWGEG